MATNGKFLGKDGAWYDNYSDWRAADTRYEQQERQNKLIEKQNKLIEEQNIRIEQHNKLNYELEKEKIQKNYELEINKMQHEEKMRILRLFDDIGISKETYDAYINSNFMTEINKELLEQRENHLALINKYDFLLHQDDKIEELGMEYVVAIKKENDIFNLEEEIESTCYIKIKGNKLKQRKELLEKIKKYKKYKKISTYISVFTYIIFFILIFSMMNIEDDAVGTIFAIFIINGVIAVSSIILASIIFPKCITSYNNELSLKYKEKVIDYDLKDKKIKGAINKEHKTAKEIEKQIFNNCTTNLENFYDFRINHYNVSVEKLLIDVGFKQLIENLGLKYNKINNSNKKKDGTIEDYIEYFENNS